MLVKDIPRGQLAYYCAKAQGLKVKEEYGGAYTKQPVYKPDPMFGGCMIDEWKPYSPLTNGQQVYDLIVEFNLFVNCGKDISVAGCSEFVLLDKDQIGADPAEAVCRAVIASHYGEEVRDAI